MKPLPSRTAVRARHSAWPALAGAAGLLLLPLGAALAQEVAGDAVPQPSVEETRAALQQWVETERIISQEKRDLALSKEVLGERIRLVQSEIDSLRKRIAEAEESISEADTKREEFLSENARLTEATNSLDGVLGMLEKHTLAMLPRLPEPLRERVKPLSQRIPKDDEERGKLSSSQRFQNVIGILNEINKFNREITVTSEVRSLADGNSAEVTVLYLGIGHAFYVDGSTRVAGVGTATADNWVWTPVNDSAADIAKAIAILQNEQVASFTHVPVVVE